MSKLADTDIEGADDDYCPDGYKDINVPLTEGDRLEYSERQSDAQLALEALEEKKSNALKGFNAEIKVLESKISTYATIIRERKHKKRVRIRTEVVGSTVRVLDDATGDVVETREATDLERQPSLPVEGTGHVAIDSDGIERSLTAKQAERFRDSRAKGKAFTVTIDGAKVRLTHFKGELALNLTPEPVPPPPAAPRGLILAVLAAGGHAPLTEEQEAYVQAGLARKEKPAIDVLGCVLPVSGLRYPRMQEVDAAGIGDQGVDVDGEFHDLAPWWAEMARIELSQHGRAFVRDRAGQTVRIAAMRPCEQCGAADGHHRSEGHDRTPVEPEPVDSFDLVTDPEAEADAEADTEAVAMAIEQQELVPTRPRRGRKAKRASAEVQ